MPLWDHQNEKTIIQTNWVILKLILCQIIVTLIPIHSRI